MQGTYRDAAQRAHISREWTESTVPNLAREETEPLRELINGKKGMIAIDVGANKGFWAAALLRTFPGQIERIHMFEPSPENYRELTRYRDNIMFTPEEQERVTPYPLAMGDTPGVATLHTNDEGSPLASLYPRANTGHGGSLAGIALSRAIQVPVDTVDAFIERQGLTRVDILKVDVEGYEMPVFRGAEKTLRAGIVELVAYEFGIHQIESRNSFRDFHDMFSDFKYRMFRVEGCVLRPIERYSYAYENFTTVHTMVAHRAAAKKSLWR